MEKKQITIPIIVGPTSTGKTSLALELCSKIEGEILSADSRQVYTYMDIGTGKKPINSKEKITQQQYHWLFNNIPVWGYDLTTPDEFFSAHDYAVFGLKTLKEIISRHKKPLIVGGTGFYIDILTKRVIPAGVLPNLKLRKELAQLDLAELQNRLNLLNTEAHKKIDQQNPVRLIRAIEKFSTSSEFETKPLEYLENVNFKFIGLTAPREHLFLKADFWLESIWAHGLLEETEILLQKFPNSEKLQGLVYKSAVDYLQGIDKDAKERAKFSLHAYIRRQQTYFKKNNYITWIDISQDNKYQKVYNIINE